MGILKREGYISDFGVEGKIPKIITVKLKYQGKKSVIEGLRRISTPGLRRYVGATEIPRVRGGLGVAVLSTSEGVTDRAPKRARKTSAASCSATCGKKHEREHERSIGALECWSNGSDGSQAAPFSVIPSPHYSITPSLHFLYVTNRKTADCHPSKGEGGGQRPAGLPLKARRASSTGNCRAARA